MRGVLLTTIATTCFAAGCSGDAPGLLRACFFTDEEDGSEETVSDSDVVMTGVHLASEPTEPGESYLGCESGMLAPTRFELVDEDDRHAWLGVDLHREDPDEDNFEPPPPLELPDVVNARLFARRVEAWIPSQTFELSDDEGAILAFQVNARNDDVGAELSTLAVEPGGATALPSVTPCGSGTALSLRIAGDSDAVLANGQSGSVSSGSRALTARNVSTFALDGFQEVCEDVEDGVRATWIAHASR